MTITVMLPDGVMVKIEGDADEACVALAVALQRVECEMVELPAEPEQVN